MLSQMSPIGWGLRRSFRTENFTMVRRDVKRYFSLRPEGGQHAAVVSLALAKTQSEYQLFVPIPSLRFMKLPNFVSG